MRRLHGCGGFATGVLAAALLLLLTAGPVAAEAGVYRRALRSTGWVVVPSKDGLAAGTCWLADRDRRLAVTCQHVVGDSREVLVYFPRYEHDRPLVEVGRYLRDGPAVAGRVVAADAVRDLALLRLDSVPDGVRALPLAEESCGPGDEVHGIGNSGLGQGLDGTLWWYNRGTVRQVHRRAVEADGASRGVWTVETQAPVNEGDSGGPVVDDQGRLVGVTDAYAVGRQLVSQAVDVREVRAFLKEGHGAGAKEAADGRPTPVGAWDFAGDDVKAVKGRAEFRPDGTFQLSRPSGPVEGRYAYANGALWLIAPKSVAVASPAWEGGDHFTLKLGEHALNFRRKPPEAEPPAASK